MLLLGDFPDRMRMRVARWVGCVCRAGQLGVALALRALLFAAPPILSSDVYRYVWDGRVQAAAINPYLFVPADPALAAPMPPLTAWGETEAAALASDMAAARADA